MSTLHGKTKEDYNNPNVMGKKKLQYTKTFYTLKCILMEKMWKLSVGKIHHEYLSNEHIKDYLKLNFMFHDINFENYFR